MAAFLLSLTAVTTNYRAAYKFMTNPMIVFTYTLVLFFGLLIDRVLDSLVTKHKLPTVKKKRLPNSFVVSAEDEMASIDTGRTLNVSLAVD
ncbi:hypothetical protein KEM55_006497 [Ascosphaera atra]|nr:hypothetical protein KEM55_006497 [Ascosphaera atra]